MKEYKFTNGGTLSIIGNTAMLQNVPLTNNLNMSSMGVSLDELYEMDIDFSKVASADNRGGTSSSKSGCNCCNCD